MKRVLLAVMMIFLIQNAAYADEDMEKSEKLETKKGKILERINKKRGLLNEFEGCIKSAGAREDLKSCRKQHKEKRDAMRAERKARKGKRE